MPTNEIQPFATGVGANVLSAAAWAALAARSSGFSTGEASSEQCNTAWRQSAFVTAALAQLVVDTLAEDVLDNGDVAALKAQIEETLTTIAQGVVDSAGTMGSGAIYGAIMANTVGHETTRITVTTGECRDSTNTANITLPAPLTKRLDAAWAVGNNNGGRDTGSLAIDQTWHFFLILKPADGTVDGLFSQSSTSPTLPTGFTKFRRVGSVVLHHSSTDIRRFLQFGDWFKYRTAPVDYNAAMNGTGGPYLRRISVPSGIKVEAEIKLASNSNASYGTPAYPGVSLVWDPDFGTPTGYGGWGQIAWHAVDPDRFEEVVLRQFTDHSAQVYTYSSDPSDQIELQVLGWRDDRGRFF